MVNIEKALVNDAAMLSVLARDIYKEHYLHLWHPGGAAWYMNEYAYAADKIAHDLADPGVEYYIAFQNEAPVGYLKLLLNAALPGYETFNAIEVERIYLHRQVTGKGIGKQLMNLAMQKALQLKKDMVFLKAMDSSTAAIAFYKKEGYSICGSTQLPQPEFELMQEKFRGMVIMKKTVE
jgi:GNAT superfamily N-acetyltransferase